MVAGSNEIGAPLGFKRCLQPHETVQNAKSAFLCCFAFFLSLIFHISWSPGEEEEENMTTDKPVLNCMHFHPHLLNLAA